MSTALDLDQNKYRYTPLLTKNDSDCITSIHDTVPAFIFLALKLLDASCEDYSHISLK